MAQKAYPTILRPGNNRFVRICSDEASIIELNQIADDRFGLGEAYPSEV